MTSLTFCSSASLIKHSQALKHLNSWKLPLIPNRDSINFTSRPLYDGSQTSSAFSFQSILTETLLSAVRHSGDFHASFPKFILYLPFIICSPLVRFCWSVDYHLHNLVCSSFVFSSYSFSLKVDSASYFISLSKFLSLAVIISCVSASP